MLAGPGGRRVVPAAEFFTSFLETALRPDELLVEVRIPLRERHGWAYAKYTRRALEWATVAVAAVIGPVHRVALVNMGPTPLRASAVERALDEGVAPSAAAALAADGTTPPVDDTADAAYRSHLARVLTARALAEAADTLEEPWPRRP